MDVEKIRGYQSNLSKVFAQVGFRSNSDLSRDGQYDAVTEDGIPSSLSNLPTFPMMKEIGDKKSALLKLQNDQHLKPFLKSSEKTEGIVREGVVLSEQLATCLEFLHNSSKILEQALKDPMTHDALPLPHNLHRKAVEAIEACIWMIQHQRWSPLNYEVDWTNVLPKLQEEVATWISSSRQSEKQLKELKDLKQKLDTVFERYPLL